MKERLAVVDMLKLIQWKHANWQTIDAQVEAKLHDPDHMEILCV